MVEEDTTVTKPHFLISVGLLIFMTIGLIGIYFLRWYDDYRFGAGSSYFASLIIVIPPVVILGLTETIKPTSITALYGTIIGYVLASWDFPLFSNDDENENDENGNDNPNEQ